MQVKIEFNSQLDIVATTDSPEWTSTTREQGYVVISRVDKGVNVIVTLTGAANNKFHVVIVVQKFGVAPQVIQDTLTYEGGPMAMMDRLNLWITSLPIF